MKLDQNILIHPFRFEDFILSIIEDENTESLRGFVYPKTFRNVHRDPESKFYVSKKDFSKDIYPEYPALTYLMSSAMVFKLSRLLYETEKYLFPVEDALNCILLDYAGLGNKIKSVRRKRPQYKTALTYQRP